MPSSLTLWAAAALLAPLAAAQTPPDTFFLVHAEPNEYSPSRFWDLQDLVLEAEARHVRLSIESGTTWAQAITGNPAMLAEVRSWVSRGHAIGAHHHDVDHPFWDQYTDLDPASITRPEPVLGTMADFAAIHDALARAIGVGPDTVQFGGLDDSITYEYRYGAWFVGHAYLGAGERAKLTALINLHTGTFAPDKFGFTIHVSDYASDPTLYTDWLDSLASRDPAGLYNRTVPEILQPHGRALEVNPAKLPVGGGTVTFTLQTDAALAGHTVQFLLSMAGSEPGFERGGPSWNDKVHIGLDPDAWTSWSMSPAGSPYLTGFLGTLDAAGSATASLDTLGPLPASWIGTVITATAVAYDTSGITFSANPVGVEVR